MGPEMVTLHVSEHVLTMLDRNLGSNGKPLGEFRYMCVGNIIGILFLFDLV